MSFFTGAAHVAGKYPSSASFLTTGFNAIKALGPNLTAVKLYLSPAYTTDYPGQTWGGSYTSVAALAADPAFAAIFSDDQVTTYFLNVFTFSTGITNPWINTVPDSLLSGERAEIQALAAYLLTTYAGSGKTFIIQNWEGDWALIGSFIPTDYVPPYRPERMAAFLRARQQGIEAAKASAGAAGCRVLFAMEVNRVLDDGRRVHADVLPLIKPDLVSLSAYEAINTWGSDMGDTVANIDTLLRRVVARVRASSDCPIYIGEYGFPELEVPVWFDTGEAIEQVVDTAAALGLLGHIYWQVYDNEEISPGVPRGYYLVKPNGDQSAAGLKIISLVS